MTKNHKRKRHKEVVNGWIVSDNDLGPSRKMKCYGSWIESEIEAQTTKAESTTPRLSNSLCQQSLLTKFYEHFTKKEKFKSENIILRNKPFQVATVDNFLENKFIIKSLVKEMELLDWTRKQMDLYEFYQTMDLANIKLPFLSGFYKFLKNEVRCYLQHITGMKFQKVSASCSMYNFGDHLLTHDDLLSDRMIAFVYYLSPWKGKQQWDETMGGALELFSMDDDGQPKFPVTKKIFPSNNQFVFFKVERRSFHQVGEVLTKEFPRLTINGWFHGFNDNPDFDSEATKVKKPNVPMFKTPRDIDDLDLSNFIRKIYLKKSIKISIQKAIEESSEMSLGEFLTRDCYNSIYNELKGKLTWILKGPSNQQSYEILDLNSLKSSSKLKLIVDMFSSNAMMKLLHEYTELDLYGSKAKRPKLTLEIQRWKGGCYTLLGDSSTYDNETLDLFLYFGNNENVGVVNYLTPEGDNSSASSDNEDDEPTLLTIYPQNNYLNIVYRSEGTTKFTKYVSKLTCMDTEFNYIVACSYKE